VGFVPEALVQRWPDRRDMSQPATSRDFTALALAKMGVARLTYPDGRCREAAQPQQAQAA
jgi:hypothetical protein